MVTNLKKNIKMTIGIIGYRRFGKLLANLLEEDFEILVYDTNRTTDIPNHQASTIDQLLQLNTIFIAVPIRCFATVITEISAKLQPSTVIIDVCSVKVHPVEIMKKTLPKFVDIIATHPLFGPDSLSAGKNLTIMMHKERDATQQYDFWKNYFQNKKFKIIEMTPNEHDQLTAKSQSVTHFIGRALQEAHIESTPIDTLGFKSLLQLKEQTCHDSWELFYDLQIYNPYTEGSINNLIESIHKIHEMILEHKSDIVR